jgi:hypothetical protein
MSASVLSTERDPKKLKKSASKEKATAAKKGKSSTSQTRKYSIFSATESDSDSTEYVDVNQQNRARKQGNDASRVTSGVPKHQKLHVNTYELDSSSDIDRVTSSYQAESRKSGKVEIKQNISAR